MSDLISRQAAIDVLEERLQANGYSNVALVSELNRSIGYLMQLPPAQPKHGRWLSTPTAWVYCSVCGSEPPNESNEETPYCAYCGAKMDEEG